MNSWIEFANGDLVYRDDKSNAIIRIYRATYLDENTEEMQDAEMVWDIAYIYDRWSYTEIVPMAQFDKYNIKGYAEWMYRQAGRIIPKALADDEYRD
jgi:hypothetical protein